MEHTPPRDFLICSLAGLETGPDNETGEGASVVLGVLQLLIKQLQRSWLFEDANPGKGPLNMNPYKQGTRDAWMAQSVTCLILESGD